MRLRADETVPLPSVDLLVSAGYDVVSISRESPGASNPSVLARARAEDRLLVTFDRDFGELVFARGVSAFPGVIFLRFVPRSPTESAPTNRRGPRVSLLFVRRTLQQKTRANEREAPRGASLNSSPAATRRAR